VFWRKREIQPRADGRRDASVYALYAPKGGVGKTTLAVNLAVVLSERRRNRVLLIDADLQFGGIASALDLNENGVGPALNAFLAEGDWNLARRSLIEFTEGDSAVDVLPAPHNPWEAERIPQGAVRNLIEMARPNYDRILVDVHSSYNNATMETLDIADGILLIITPEAAVVRNARGFLHMIDPLGYLAKVSLVVNRYGDGLTLEQIRNQLGIEVQGTVESAGPLVVEATNVGRPLVVARPRASVSANIREVSNLILPAPTRAAAANGGGRPLPELDPSLADLPLSAFSPQRQAAGEPPVPEPSSGGRAEGSQATPEPSPAQSAGASRPCPNCGWMVLLMMTACPRCRTPMVEEDLAGGDPETPRIGQLLLRQGVLSAQDLETAMARQQEAERRGEDQPFGDLLVELGFATRERIEAALAQRQEGFTNLFRS
jgi:MinD-like ATPase involved in chromosome partitioning or flagellar assembly